MATALVFLLGIVSVFSLRRSEYNDAQFDISNLFQTFDAPDGFFFPATALRLGFHDSGTFSVQTNDGGPHATQVFNCLPGQSSCEKTTGDNAGLSWAVSALEKLYQAKYKSICSRADFWQIAAITGIEDTGGPRIPFKWGRKDSVDAGNSKLGRLPSDLIDHNGVRQNMGSSRLGLTDREIVAILGAHTIGHTHAVTGHGGHWDDSPFVWDNHYYQSLMVDDWAFVPARNGKQQQWEAKRGREILIMLDPDFALKRVLSQLSQKSPFFFYCSILLSKLSSLEL